MYFDTHAHYDDEAFDDDREALLAAQRLFVRELSMSGHSI